MKRLLTLGALFLCSLLTFAQFSMSGSGTESDPYKITNPIHLNQLRNYLNQSNVYFKLMDDIDLTDFLGNENPLQGWQPVGNSSSAAFKGILDGNGKKITGLWIDRSGNDYVGFFGYTTGATIKNVTIVANTIAGNDNVGGVSGYSDNSTFNGVSFTGEVRGHSFAGGLVGSGGDFLTLTNCSTEVEVSSKGDYAGGLIGKNDASNKFSVTGCYVNNSLISGRKFIGGACGGNIGNHSNSNTMTSCYVHANVSGANQIGGICGRSENGSHTINMSNCGFIGNVDGSSYVGGLIGYVKKNNSGSNDNIQQSFAISNISVSGDYVGGLIGYDEGYYYSYYGYYYYANISNCYFSGSVVGTNYVGGLVGYKKYGEISKCYAVSSIAGTKYVGGLVGELKDNTTIKTSVANNTRVSATESNVGRIVGVNNGIIPAIGSTEENKSYNRTIVLNQGVAQEITDDIQNGTSVSASTLKLKATYVAMGWDFTNIWAIQETECFPYMKSQTAPPVITSKVVSGVEVVSGKCIDGGTVTLEIDGVKQQKVSSGNTFSFNVSPLQAGHEVRVCAKADNKEQSYYTIEIVSYLGSGTEADPYQVYTAADLTGVYRKGYFKLMNDIDLTDYINMYSPTEGWESIGREGSETIYFNGNGHKITGLWCNTTRDNTGLFSCFANGYIKNLTVETANGKQVKGGNNTGIMIGRMINSTIENCIVSGATSGGINVGGMVGLFDSGVITHCQASSTVNAVGANSFVGGLAGRILTGTVSKNISTTTLTTTGANTRVGGLAGEIAGGEVDQCFSDGTLTATGTESYVGGLIGQNSATVTNCYSNAKASSSYNAAGLIAYNYGLVEKCYATGDLSSNNFAAGVIGYNDGENAVIRNSTAMNNKIDVTYESQQVQQGGGYGQRILGGFKNNAPTPDKTNNFALKTMQVSLNDVPQIVYDDIMNGTAKTAAELTAKATYQALGWDFSSIWNIEEGTGYPCLPGATTVNPSNPSSGGNGEAEGGNNDPDTDISHRDNIIYLDKVEAKVGTQITLSIKMKNSAAIRGFQFDLYLPEGVTVAKSPKGKILGALSTDRLPDEDEHSLTFSEQADGAIRFLCSSQYDETFTGNDGEIATLIVNIGDEMEDGDYAIVMKNMKLTETNINNYYETSYVKSTLTISSYMLGDINSDGVVDVSDYTGVANHIHGNTPAGFVTKAADVDVSGTIDVSDYTGIANIIHTGSIYGNNSASRMLSPRKANTDLSTFDNVMYISPFTASANSQISLSIKMKNTAEIRGFQFDLYLPEGMTVVKSVNGRIQGSLSAGRLPDEDEHELTFSEQANGAIRFLCSSQYDETFTGNDGEIATLKVNVGDLENGDYSILLKDMKLTETDISNYYETELIETTVTIGEVDTRTILDEMAETAPSASDGPVNVRVKRTINPNEWSTICLPFAMSADQIQTAFGDDVTVELADAVSYETTEDDDDNIVSITINFNNVSPLAIEANHPYIIRVSSSITSFDVDGVVVNPATNVSGRRKKIGTGSYFIGNYENGIEVPEFCLFLSGNKFWYSIGDTKIKAFRGYFDLKDVLADVDEAYGSRISFSFDEATGIQDNNRETITNNRYYDLQGRSVGTPAKKGLYINNGKKVVVK